MDDSSTRNIRNPDDYPDMERNAFIAIRINGTGTENHAPMRHLNAPSLFFHLISALQVVIINR